MTTPVCSCLTAQARAEGRTKPQGIGVVWHHSYLTCKWDHHQQKSTRLSWKRIQARFSFPRNGTVQASWVWRGRRIFFPGSTFCANSKHWFTTSFQAMFGVCFLCWLLFWYLFHPRVTAVAHKISRSVCQKCRWQFLAKHECILRMRLSMKWRDMCLVVWLTLNVRLDGSSFTWHQPCNDQTALYSTSSVRWIFKILLWKAL